MTKISGIFAATMSVFNSDLSLNVEKTIEHAEKLIVQGCHGTAIFGSTGQAQLIPISEKIKLLNNLSYSKFRDKHLIGTGLNSLNETINFMKIATSLKFHKFLIMPPAYYKYHDNEVIDFYSNIANELKEAKIILYNFEKLSGYKFSVDCIKKLVSKFPQQIVGVKDSSYNLYENLKIDNFSIMPGSESKLLRGLELGCSGIITATTNITGSLAREVYDNFNSNFPQSSDKKLCAVRSVFDNYNLISSLHTLMMQKNLLFKNLLPPLKLLNETEESELLSNLKKLNFNMEILKAA